MSENSVFFDARHLGLNSYNTHSALRSSSLLRSHDTGRITSLPRLVLVLGLVESSGGRMDFGSSSSSNSSSRISSSSRTNSNSSSFETCVCVVETMPVLCCTWV